MATTKVFRINSILMIFLFLYCSQADEIQDQVDSNQADKSPVIGELHPDDDLIKAESQDMIEHKAYPTVNQPQYENAPVDNAPQVVYHQPAPHDSLRLGLPLHMLNRPGYMLSNLPPPNIQASMPSLSHYNGHRLASGSSGPPNLPVFSGPPTPVYTHKILPAQHLQENQVEFGPEPNQNHGYQAGYENNYIQPYKTQVQPQPQPQQQVPHQQQQPQQFGLKPSSEVDKSPLPIRNLDLPKIINLDVKCEKNLMKVAIDFDKPFFGTIFSKGHYHQSECIHEFANSGKMSVFFDIGIGKCGTVGNTQNGLYGHGSESGSGSYFENTIIVQYDSLVQEVWDQARRLRCSWHEQYEKSVSFRPFPVDVLDVVRADFAGDNVGCWMQIQVGKGPWASEVAGIVKIGQTMTMVLAIKDEENKFDMLVRNCVAHDGKRSPIELVDSNGCIVRNNIMSKFTKIRNFGSSATVLSYAHFQTFKFPDSLEVHFQCMIQICKHQCPAQCSSEEDGESNVSQQHQENFAAASNHHSMSKSREERDLSAKLNNLIKSEYTVDSTEIGLNKIIQVVSTGDLAFSVASNESVPILDALEDMKKVDLFCMSTINFATSIIILLAILVISCLLSIFLCLQHRATEKTKLAELSLPYEIRAYPQSQKFSNF